jgi:hypothetical protein
MWWWVLTRYRTCLPGVSRAASAITASERSSLFGASTTATKSLKVTHDVDEALYLAMVGDTLQVPFPRPRARAAVLGHPDYHRCRRHVIDFLEHHAHQSRPSALDDVLRKRMN